MLFRMVRSGIKSTKVKLYDYYYFRDKGWFESNYYYEIKLGPLKKMMEKIFDCLGSQLFK